MGDWFDWTEHLRHCKFAYSICMHTCVSALASECVYCLWRDGKPKAVWTCDRIKPEHFAFLTQNGFPAVQCTDSMHSHMLCSVMANTNHRSYQNQLILRLETINTARSAERCIRIIDKITVIHDLRFTTAMDHVDCLESVEYINAHT